MQFKVVDIFRLQQSYIVEIVEMPDLQTGAFGTVLFLYLVAFITTILNLNIIQALINLTSLLF